MSARAGKTLLLMIVAFVAFGGGRALAEVGLDADPSQVVFGERAVGQEYGTRDIEIAGSGTPGVTIAAVDLAGPDQGDFSLDSSDCDGRELGDGWYCYLTVDFKPSVAGARSASVRIETGEGESLVVPLSGAGVDPAANAPALSAPALGQSSVPNQIWSFTGGDFQGQGRDGLVMVSQMEDYSIGAGFSFGQADGTLTDPVWLEVAAGGFPGSAATGDLDGDADLDAVAAGGGGARAFLNDGQGAMAGGAFLPSDPDGIEGNLTVGEFTGDSNLDVLAGFNSYDEEHDVYGYMLEVFPGHGDGTFGAPTAQQTDLDGPMGMATGNFDGDGIDDLAVTTWAGLVVMYAGEGDGTFSEVGRFGPPCGCQSPWGVTTADLDGDGLDDVVATMRFEDEIATFLARPGGGFAAGQRLAVPYLDGYYPNPIAVSAGDLNGDDVPDLLTADYLNDSGAVFVGNGDGTVSFAEMLPTSEEGVYPQGAYIGDFDGDGRLDGSLGGQLGTIATYLNQGEPGQVPIPASVEFGQTVSGTESEPVTVELKNADGLAKLRVSGVSIGGGDSSDFELRGGNCDAGAIPAGGSCRVELAFAPAGPAGSRSSTLFFDTNHPEETQVSVPLSGTAVDPPPPAPGISIDPVSHDFGAIRVGAESAPKGFAVTSSGSAPLAISAVTVSGPAAADFPPVSNDCVGTLQPGAGCVVSLRFKPSAAGSRSATVSLSANLPGEPARIALSGSGTAGPVAKPPRVIVKRRPRAKIRIHKRKLRKVKVKFRSDQAGARFRCRIDRKRFRKCHSPKVYRWVKPGRHAIRIRAAKNGRTGPVKVIRFRVIRRR